jgi:putative membrane protein
MQAPPAHAHGAIEWVGAAWVAIALAVTLALYARGVRALWTSAGDGRGVMARGVAMFAAGWLVLAASLLGPVDRWSEELFSMHMVQHELMMLVAAPLLVLGAPLPVWAWSMPPRARRAVGRATRGIGRSAAWRALTRPSVAWLLHGGTLWAWHMPAPFAAAIENRALHDLQHVTFLGTALLFWWSLLRPGGSRRAHGAAILFLFTTMLHTGALGALLTFSPQPWYPPYGASAANWGLTALRDQQLGGLVMWVPGGLVYLVAALALMARWLRQQDDRAPPRRERLPMPSA